MASSSDTNVVDRLEMAFAQEHFELKNHLEKKRQSVSQLEYQVSLCETKNAKMENELCSEEQEIMWISEHNKRMELHIKRLREAAPLTEKIIKVLEKEVEVKRKQVESDGKRLAAIVEENRALVQRYYVQYESIPMAQEVRQLKMKLEEAQDQMRVDEKNLIQLKKKFEDHTRKTKDTQWKRIQEKVIELARLKSQTANNVAQMQETQQLLRRPIVTMDVEIPKGSTGTSTREEEMSNAIQTEEIGNGHRDDTPTASITVDQVKNSVAPSPSPSTNQTDDQRRRERSPVFKMPTLIPKKTHRSRNAKSVISVLPPFLQQSTETNQFISNCLGTSEMDTCQITDIPFIMKDITGLHSSDKQNAAPAISFFGSSFSPNSQTNNAAEEYANFEFNAAGFYTSPSSSGSSSRESN